MVEANLDAIKIGGFINLDCIANNKPRTEHETGAFTAATRLAKGAHSNWENCATKLGTALPGDVNAHPG
eukprot:1932867-Pyramimonas_sp.AAC.1